MFGTQDFFTDEEKQAIENAIAEAEKMTSGEIRLHIDGHCLGEVKKRAVTMFNVLGMQNTKLRNGVLFYLAVKEKLFYVLGDKGIDDVVPDNFWNDIYAQIKKDFSQKHFSKGLCKAITAAGEQLSKNFPIQTDDVNELPNDISFGK